MLMRWRTALRTVTAILLLAAAPTNAVAQATSQIPLQFSFITPGARSLAMGGAFLGAADDATAASSNPAGVDELNAREMSAEFRFQRSDTPFLNGGRVSGVVTGVGLDTISGPTYGLDIRRATSLPFVSAVIPLSHVNVALYRHEVARMDNTFFSNGPFQRGTFAGVTDDRIRELPLGGTRRIDIASYGAAAALNIGPRLAVGAGLAAYTFDLSATFHRFNVTSDAFSPANPAFVTATAVQAGDDVSIAPNVGVLWKANYAVKVGAQFRRGPRFDFTQTDDVPLNRVHLVRTGTFKVPDVAGVGVEWRLHGAEDPNAPADQAPSYLLRLLTDYTYVRYSQLRQDFVTIQALSSGRPDRLRVANAHEVHGGLEMLLLKLNSTSLQAPVALRLGAWYDPAHAVEYVSTPRNDQLDALLGATLTGGKSLVHYTFGGGITFRSGVLGINVAADLSSSTAQVTTSAVVRF